MSRSKVTQEQPTQPRATDAQGRELDEHGLPLCGPARDLALEALGIADPNDEPEADASAGPVAPDGAAGAPGSTEKNDG